MGNALSVQRASGSGWLAAVFLVALLSGCSQAGQDPDVAGEPADAARETLAPPTAPVHAAGQWWLWDVERSVRSNETFAGESEAESTATHGTLRRQVLAPPADEAGWMLLYEQTVEGNATDSGLRAATLGDVNARGVQASLDDACEPSGRTFCAPPMSIRVREDTWPMRARFPLAIGDTWSDPMRSIDWFGGGSIEGRVVGSGLVTVGNRSLPAMHVTFNLRVDQPLLAQAMQSEFGDNATWTADLRFHSDAWYAPDAAAFVDIHSWTHLELRVAWPGDLSYATLWNGTVFRKVSSYGQADAPDLEALAKELGIQPDQPTSDDDPFDLRTIDLVLGAHPARFNVSEAWTFQAEVLGPGAEAADVGWRVFHESGFGPPAAVEAAAGTGRSHRVAFDQPGMYSVIANVIAPDGTWTPMQKSVRYFVDLRLEGTLPCAAAVSPSPLMPADACEGLAFTLPPGSFTISGASSFGTTQAPCAALAILLRGQPQTLTYAWPTPTANVEMDLAAAAPSDLELRWFPSVSQGEDVAYSLVVTALSDATFKPATNDTC